MAAVFAVLEYLDSCTLFILFFYFNEQDKDIKGIRMVILLCAWNDWCPHTLIRASRNHYVIHLIARFDSSFIERSPLEWLAWLTDFAPEISDAKRLLSLLFNDPLSMMIMRIVTSKNCVKMDRRILCMVAFIFNLLYNEDKVHLSNESSYIWY